MRLASTVVECAREAVKTLPYKNAVKFCGEKEHFNYTQFLVRGWSDVAPLTVCRTRSACCPTVSTSWA